MEWKEYRLLPKEGATHIKEGYENPCENCMKEIDCECCEGVVNLISTKDMIRINSWQRSI